MLLKGKNIIIISNEAWGDVWYSKHNYAYELSKTNNVIFINPPGRPASPFQFSSAPKITKLSATLSKLDYSIMLPSANKQLYLANNWLVSRSLHKALAKAGFKVDLYISFDPTRLTQPSHFHPTKSLFICVDRYVFSFYGETEFIHNVDGIVTISELLTANYTRFRKPLLTIGHSISSEEFVASPKPELPKGYGLYIGSIDARLDHRAINSLLQRFPQTPFVFVGPVVWEQVPAFSALHTPEQYPNLHLVGKVPFKELKSYISGASFCLAPMDIHLPGNEISHHKIFQYLALGKPTFCNVFKEYEQINDLLYMTDDIDQLLRSLSEYMEHGEDPGLIEQRIQFARSVTYESTFKRIETFLRDEVSAERTA